MLSNSGSLCSNIAFNKRFFIFKTNCVGHGQTLVQILKEHCYTPLSRNSKIESVSQRCQRRLSFSENLSFQHIKKTPLNNRYAVSTKGFCPPSCPLSLYHLVSSTIFLLCFIVL